MEKVKTEGKREDKKIEETNKGCRGRKCVKEILMFSFSFRCLQYMTSTY